MSKKFRLLKQLQIMSALASENNEVVSFSSLQRILEWANESYNAFEGPGAISSLQSYA